MVFRKAGKSGQSINVNVFVYILTYKVDYINDTVVAAGVFAFAGGAAGDYVMRAAVGERVELSERNIPTGRKLPLSEKFARLRGAGLQVNQIHRYLKSLHPPHR